MAAGGGVHGKGDGTARNIIIQVGATMKELHLFIEVYPHIGGMIIGNVVGEIINGTTSEYLSNKFNKTGKAGKGTDIGRSKTHGASRV